MARLREKYKSEVANNLKEQFAFKNVNQIPRLEKIVLNMGLGEALRNAKVVDQALNDLTLITGQKPVARRSKKSIANFKLRENVVIGASVTLRKDQMYEFADRLFNIALPRVRDFRGIPRKGFDGRGNFSMGITEQIIFPEIDLEKTSLRGLSITFVTTARTNQEGMALLEGLGLPFRSSEIKG